MESFSASLGVLSPLTCNSVEVVGVERAGPARRRKRRREGMGGSITGIGPGKFFLEEFENKGKMLDSLESVVSKFFFFDCFER